MRNAKVVRLLAQLTESYMQSQYILRTRSAIVVKAAEELLRWGVESEAEPPGLDYMTVQVDPVAVVDLRTALHDWHETKPWRGADLVVQMLGSTRDGPEDCEPIAENT